MTQKIYPCAVSASVARSKSSERAAVRGATFRRGASSAAYFGLARQAHRANRIPEGFLRDCAILAWGAFGLYGLAVLLTGVAR